MSTRIKILSPTVNTRALRKRQNPSTIIQSANQKDELRFAQYEKRIRLLLAYHSSNSGLYNLYFRLICIITSRAILFSNLSRKGYLALKKTQYPASILTVLLIITLTSLILFPLITLILMIISFISVAYRTRLHHLENHLAHRLSLIAKIFDDQLNNTLTALERRRCSILPLTHPTDYNDFNSNSVASDEIKMSKTMSSKVLHSSDSTYTLQLSSSHQTQLLESSLHSQREPKVPLGRLTRSGFATSYEVETKLTQPRLPLAKFDTEGWLIINKPESHAID